MKFELHDIEPEKLHPSFRPVAELWVGGKPVEAYRTLDQEFRAKNGVQDGAAKASADDWLFAIDVLSGCGFFDQGKLLTRRAWAKFPDSPWLGMLMSWDLAADGKLFECRESLVKLKEKLPKEWLPIIHAINVYNYSFSGWRVSAEKTEVAALKLAGENPLANYILARAAARRSEWKQAGELGRRAVELAPRWSRARGALTDSLLAVGQLDETWELFRSMPANSLPFFSLDFSRAILKQAAGDIPAAIQSLEQTLERWPLRSRYHRFAAYQLALLQMNNGEDKQASEIVKKFRLRRLGVDRKSESRQKKFIILPLVSQTHNHCVPTVAAMAAGAQGVPAQPLEYAQGMMTRHGTPMWRMVSFMQSQGFRAVCVLAEISVIQKMLDQNVPLIGTLNGLFSSHVDVICGYDEGLQLLHVRDPMHWFGRSISWEDVPKKYRDSAGLWALIAPHRIDEVEVRDEWLDVSGAALAELLRACSNADLALAERSFAAIPDDHPQSLSRDSAARGIVITPGQFEKSLDRHAMLGDDLAVEQIRAVLMRINPENAERVSELMEHRRVRLKDDFVNYVQAQCQMALHRWTDAEKMLRKVARKIPQLESVWSTCCDVYEQLGRADDAALCLKNAMDIAPDSLGLIRRRVELESLKEPFDQRYARAHKIASEYVDHADTCYMLAEILADGGDGLAYEEILKRCVKYYPRNPWCYNQLAGWYLMQNREDLAGPLLAAGRGLIGIDELPKWEFELTPEEKKAAEEPGENPDPKSAESSEPKTATVADKIELLSKAAGESNFAGLIEIQATKDLLAEESAGKLAWLDSVRFRSLLVRKSVIDILADENDEKTGLVNLGLALPSKSMPGIPEIYVKTLLASIEGAPVRGQAARTLLEWIDKTCPNSAAYADLAFTRAWLLEQTGKFNDAEKVLEEIIELHPAYSPAWYRKGTIAASRNDYSAAVSHMKKAISIQPSSAGALEEIVNLLSFMKDDSALEWREKLTELMPYSSGKRYLVALARGRKSGNVDVALNYMEQHVDLIGPSEQVLMGARLLADFGQHAKSLERLEGFEPNSNNQRIVDWIRVDAQVEQEQFNEALETLEGMLEREPDDNDVADQLVRVLRQVSPEKSRTFCEEKLRAGHALPLFGYVAAVGTPDPAQFAIDLVPTVDEKKRAAVAICFSRAFGDAELLQSLMKYLKWACKEMPQLVDLQELYAIRLNMQGRDREATAIAKKLAQRYPDDPRWMSLMGIVIQDYDAKKSITWLEKEFAITGSAETLTRLARGHQLAGDMEQARKLYYQALELNPYDSLAVSNLALKFNESTPKLFEFACGALVRGAGPDDQYFLVVCVNLAKQLGKVLPAEWFPLALRRMEMVLAEGGFMDEKKRLDRALAAWASQRPDDARTHEFRAGWLTRLAGRFVWPGHNWIPKA